METVSIDIEKYDSYVKISLIGAFIAPSFQSFAEKIRKIITEGTNDQRYLVVDLTRVTIFTSACLDSLFAEKKRADSFEWNLVIVTPNEQMRELFELTGFNRFFPLYRSIDEFLNKRKNNTSLVRKLRA